MRHSGRISLGLSLAIHGGLIGAAMFSIRATTLSPPRIHLVYGEHGGDNGRASIVASGADAPPLVNVEAAKAGGLTEGIDWQILGHSFDAVAGTGSNIEAPLLMTADGGNSPAPFAGETEATPKFSFK